MIQINFWVKLILPWVSFTAAAWIFSGMLEDDFKEKYKVKSNYFDISKTASLFEVYY